jgi:flagellar hook-associated protein 3 FlgL
VFDTAMRSTAQASAGVTGLRANVGLAEERIARSSERISIQTDIVESNISKLEAVDPAEVSVRISALLTQIETSYSLTARIHQMSLLNYL